MRQQFCSNEVTMGRHPNAIQVAVICGVVLAGGLSLCFCLVHRVETRIERNGWLLCFSNTRAAPQPGRGRVERFECKGKPVPAPATPVKPTGQYAVLLSCPVGLLVFEDPKQGWRVMAARKEDEDNREIETPDTQGDISEAELARGYYSLSKVHELQFDQKEMSVAVLRKTGTPDDWCLITCGSSGGVWCSPDAVAQILQGVSTAPASWPS